MKWLVLLILTGGGLALAEEKASAKLPPELRNCVEIDRNTERLACFDRGISAILQGSDAPAPSAESSFGLVASTSRTGTPRDGQEDQLESVRGKVAAVDTARDGSSVVTLDNGQVWRQISGSQMMLQVGDEVVINRAALGSFQMIVPSGRNGKVKRLR